MEIIWGTFWRKSCSRLKLAWLVTAGVIAIYLGAVEPMNRIRGIASQRGTGLAARAEWQPTSLWRQTRLIPKISLDKNEGVIGGLAGGVASSTAYLNVSSIDTLAAASAGSVAAEDRKTIVTSWLDLIVKNPHESSEKIREVAERAGGFLVSAETYGTEGNASAASVTVRVPRGRFEELRNEIRKLGVRVESEKLEAQDVTKQYVDQSARLRNLQAQETQYLGILKQARTVKDTLEVSDKLNEVRGEIEQQQAEFEALSKQVETVALSISLRAEADMRVFGLHWRPLYQLKSAARQGLDGLGDYAASMASVLFYLPTVLLWLATILIGAAIGWRIMRWARHALFVTRTKAA